MKKILLTALITFGIALGATVFAAPSYIFQRSIFPEVDSTYILGTTTLKWKNLYTDQICLGGTCNASWPNSSFWTDTGSVLTPITSTRGLTINGTTTLATTSMAFTSKIGNTTDGYFTVEDWIFSGSIGSGSMPIIKFSSPNYFATNAGGFAGNLAILEDQGSYPAMAFSALDFPDTLNVGMIEYSTTTRKFAMYDAFNSSPRVYVGFDVGSTTIHGSLTLPVTSTYLAVNSLGVIIATSTPILVESDPIWIAASSSYAKLSNSNTFIGTTNTFSNDFVFGSPSGTISFNDSRGHANNLGLLSTHLSEENTNTLLDKSRSTLSCTGGVLTYTLIAVNGSGTWNFDGVVYPDTTASSSIALTGGTNLTPKVNYVYYYLNGGVPTLAVSLDAEPTASPHIDVAEWIVGAVSGTDYTIYSYNRSRSEIDFFVNRTIDRFENEGTLYLSGFQPSASATTLSIGASPTLPGYFYSGIFKFFVEATTSAALGFTYNDNTGYVTSTALSSLGHYVNGTNMSSNQYANIVWGIVPISTTDGGASSTQPRLIAVLQSEPASPYTSLAAAITDNYNSTNYFPPIPELKEVFVPIARTIIRKSTNQLQAFSTGNYYQDIRGRVSSGGAATVPTDISGLVPYTGATGGLDMGTFSITSTNFYGNLIGTSSLTASDDTWTLHNSYPVACSAGTFATAVGDTLTCSAATVTETDPIWTAASTSLTVSNFSSHNISQWTNDAGYVTSSGGGDAYLSHNQTFTGDNTFTGNTTLGLSTTIYIPSATGYLGFDDRWGYGVPIFGSGNIGGLIEGPYIYPPTIIPMLAGDVPFMQFVNNQSSSSSSLGFLLFGSDLNPGTATSNLFVLTAVDATGTQSYGNLALGDLTAHGTSTLATTSISKLTVSNFEIDSTGNMVKINNVSYSWPSSQGGASTVLTNNGSGTLTWESVSGGDLTFASQQNWTSVFSTGFTNTTTITTTLSTAALATTTAGTIINKLIQWTDAGGTTVKRGWIVTASAASTIVTITVNGDNILSNDTNFRVSRVFQPRFWDWYIPGTCVADATNPVGKQYYVPANTTAQLLSTDGNVGTLGSGNAPTLTYNIYDDGATTIGTAPDFTNTATITDKQFTTTTMAALSRVTLRTPACTFSTTTAADMNVNVYWTDSKWFDY